MKNEVIGESFEWDRELSRLRQTKEEKTRQLPLPLDFGDSLPIENIEEETDNDTVENTQNCDE